MKKQNIKHERLAKKKVAVGVIVLALIIVGAFFGIQKAHYYNAVANQSNIVATRELVLLGVRSLKKDAPVEPRTGDIYFPESRLYLPNPGNILGITYLDDSGDVTNSYGGLSVGTYPVRGTEKLYTASNINELFAAIPKLQSCSRGIKLLYEQVPAEDTVNELKHTVQLNNGKTLHIYLENSCPELSETADLFKNIKSY